MAGFWAFWPWITSPRQWCGSCLLTHVRYFKVFCLILAICSSPNSISAHFSTNTLQSTHSSWKQTPNETDRHEPTATKCSMRYYLISNSKKSIIQRQGFAPCLTSAHLLKDWTVGTFVQGFTDCIMGYWRLIYFCLRYLSARCSLKGILSRFVSLGLSISLPWAVGLHSLVRLSLLKSM